MREKLYIALQVALAAIVVALFLVFFGCSSQQVLPVPHPRDSVRIEVRERVDSVYVDRWHVEHTKGDTIYVHDSIYVTKWRYINKADTICVRDSVPIVHEVVKEVRKRNAYDKFTARGFWILAGLLVLIIGIRIFLRFKGFR